MNNIRKYLLEGIVVVIVLAVLLIVMFPRFMDAQVRTKITQALKNLDTTSTAIIFYYSDQLVLPKETRTFNALAWLTTPISYINSPQFIFDPFREIQSTPYYELLDYNVIHTSAQKLIFTIPIDGIYPIQSVTVLAENPRFILCSWGQYISVPPRTYIFYEKPGNNAYLHQAIYSTTNGIKSVGFIVATSQGVIPVE